MGEKGMPLPNQKDCMRFALPSNLPHCLQKRPIEQLDTIVLDRNSILLHCLTEELLNQFGFILSFAPYLTS
jgi:hypothetical protein